MTSNSPNNIILFESTISNWEDDLPDNSGDLKRDGGLEINGTGPYEFDGLGELFPAEHGRYRGKLNLTEGKLLGLVESCRREWRNTIVDHAEVIKDKDGGRKQIHPFQDNWNLANIDVRLYNKMMATLAIAGTKLFQGIFYAGDDDLKNIGKVLENASGSRELVLAMTSENFFAPWRMMYVHPKGKLKVDGSNWEIDGFWGYRHIIEHNTKRLSISNAIKGSNSKKFKISFNVDERIDTTLSVTSVADQFNLLKTLPLKTTKRTSKAQLAESLQLNPDKDEIIYFFCHGSGSDSISGVSTDSVQLVLSDGAAITPEDIAFWRDNEPLLRNPVVFINACQGGQIGSFFYRGFVQEFLSRKAGCVIGPQIDIPAVFASELASRIFSQWLKKTQKKVRLGPLLKKITQKLYTENKNPLAMTYSLFRGADLHIDWTNV